MFTPLSQVDLRKVGAAARAIEADGYDGVASMENNHDPFLALALAVAGTETERIELHTNVAIAFARSPMAVANVGRQCRPGTRQGKWNEMAAEVPDDVVHLFAAVGRYDQIANSMSGRFGGLTDALNVRANAVLPGHLPRDLIPDIRRIPTAFLEFAPPDRGSVSSGEHSG